MSIIKEYYGTLANGSEVFRYTLKNKNGMKLCVLNYGGTATELWVPDRNGCFSDVIGGYDCLESYVTAAGYQGTLVGRLANRLGYSRFTLDGVEYILDSNTDDGKHQLHGGKYGFNCKIWDVEVVDKEEPMLILHLLSPDGDEKYPGNFDVTVTYTLTNENGWVITYKATTDKPTIHNLTNHAYFNLGGYASGSILGTELMLDADSYIPMSEELIPTGEIKSVEGTPFDFRTPKAIGRDLWMEDKDLLSAGGTFNAYDHCFNFVGGAAETAVKRGEAYDAKSGRVLELYTDRPGVQLYIGNFLNDAEHPFKGGYPQQLQTLFCLETQFMPDSINHDNFTDNVLRPGEVFTSTTEYRFTTK